MDASFNIRIRRFDPSRDEQPYIASYQVPDLPQSRPMTALKALHWIYRYQEPVAYDYNCRRGSCGRCAMMIDGLPRLACYFQLSGEHLLEPLSGCPVIRDLVVDTSQWMRCFVESVNAIQASPADTMRPISGEFWRDVIYPINACRECMCCYAVCRAVSPGKDGGNYLGPGAMQQIYLRHVDGADKADRLRQAVAGGLFECSQCGLCSLVCPARIPCAENIFTLMNAARQ
jgi:succinate dehydrogenase/fumarate reductase iron-sulfur protein